MKVRAFTSCALLATALTGFAAEPWEDPLVNAINRLPARAVAVPCETEALALAIAKGEQPREASAYLASLNGTWSFKWKSSPEKDWEQAGTIRVPGCWQVPGVAVGADGKPLAVDPPLYSNITYPLAFAAPRVMADPPKHFTSSVYRNPVGLHTRTFTVPAAWRGRRIVLHFNGVSSAMYVRVNGRQVGYSEDSRLPAEFDITAALQDGTNTLEVEVFKHCDGTFLEDQDFWRLSGIFRDVWLVAEEKTAPHDLIVETKLADDYSAGTIVVRDEAGKVLLERTYAQPKLWSCEYPNLYYVTVPVGKDYRVLQVGFRKVEIKDAVVYINGKRALFMGVDRHEMQPEAGYAVTLEGMKKDLAIMRDLNINAVRTCHYPNDTEWYNLCDRAGIYLVCEANVESHGAGYGDKTLAKREDYRQSHVERGTRMVETFRNHPSVIFWSMGNESGYGPNFTAEYAAMRALDATRPIQYEGASVWRTKEEHPETDIENPMYARPWQAEAYVKNNPKKPYILCEYSHAMGNSNGGIEEYWKLVRKYPSMQGGFIWDFADQALWKTDERGRFLAYGGDFGDKPNDDNFNCNGFVTADRQYHPGAYEIKHAYRPVRVESYDWATDRAEIVNEYRFVPLSEIEQKVEKDDALGTVTYRFYRAGRLVAWDQFVRPFVPRTDLPAGTPVQDHPFKLNFWRAPTDNDRGWKMPEVCKIWKDATDAQTLPPGVTSELKVSDLGGGELFVDWTLTVPKGLPPIPRVGLTFTLPKAHGDKVSWCGLGPWENYADRATGALFGVWSGEKLNPDNYIEPGEQGYRTGCRWADFGGVRVTAVNQPFGFNAWPYPQTALEGPKHMRDVREGEALTVNIDAVQMGVGGDNSWGHRPHDPYMPKAGTYRLQFTLKR